MIMPNCITHNYFNVGYPNKGMEEFRLLLLKIVLGSSFFGYGHFRSQISYKKLNRMVSLKY